MRIYDEIIEMLGCLPVENLVWLHGFLRELFFSNDGEGEA